MRKDAVTLELRLDVFRRDAGCIAPRLGGSADDCFGALQIEHVKSDLRMGVRAPSDMAHCVTLCDGHTERGRKAGHQWNTTKANRERVRAYLQEVEAVLATPVTPEGGELRIK